MTRIMTVDDSKSLREMIAFTLRQAGYEVLEAGDGAEALAGLDNEEKVDLIITDLNMPNMDGIELTRALRSGLQYKYVPIIFLSTESQMKKKETAKEAGATGWIVKPFKPEQLLQVVKKVVG